MTPYLQALSRRFIFQPTPVSSSSGLPNFDNHNSVAFNTRLPLSDRESTANFLDFPMFRISGLESKLMQGANLESICEGCARIQNRLFGKRDRALLNNRTERPHCVEVHSSFAQLNECAKKCMPCRVFRRALLLEQSTYRGAQELESCPEPVNASLYKDLLCISVGKGETKITEAPVSCRKQPCTVSGPLRLSANPSRDRSSSSPYHNLKKWIHECEKEHGPSCSNLRWSNQNPTWLIHIQSNDLLRLVPARDLALVDYVALSYSWGDSSKMTESNWQKVMDNRSRRHRMDRRQAGFPASELSRTIRHSIRITRELGVDYIWVDSVCIPQGSNWNDEASRMHEVYGNAKFTLVAGAVEDATNALLSHRGAWLYSRLPCSLAGYSLETLAPRLDDMRGGRSRVPVSSRAWTLQEERLSPRLVYWCGQMVYWSCSRVQRNELGIEPAKHATDNCPNGPQRFMNLCWHRETEKLLEEWLVVVEDYLQRDLANATDRFCGISGMAVKYYQALMPTVSGATMEEEYIAGLWRGNFAKQLVWSVDSAADPAGSLISVAPSWSWASLPLRISANLTLDFAVAPSFQLQEERLCTSPADALDAVKQGAKVKEIRLKGRLRRLLCLNSQKVDWDAVLWKGTHGDQYRLPDPSMPIHTRNAEDGRLLIYEGHTEPFVGHLDYCRPNSTSLGQNVHVVDGAETELFALEVGLHAMLLLHPVDLQMATYRRVGACRDYCKGFFDGSATEWIALW